MSTIVIIISFITQNLGMPWTVGTTNIKNMRRKPTLIGCHFVLLSPIVSLCNNVMKVDTTQRRKRRNQSYERDDDMGGFSFIKLSIINLILVGLCKRMMIIYPHFSDYMAFFHYYILPPHHLIGQIIQRYINYESRVRN